MAGGLEGVGQGRHPHDLNAIVVEVLNVEVKVRGEEVEKMTGEYVHLIEVMMAMTRGASQVKQAESVIVNERKRESIVQEEEIEACPVEVEAGVGPAVPSQVENNSCYSHL